MQVIIGFVLFIASCILIYNIGFLAFLGMAFVIAFIVWVIYLWGEINNLQEELTNVESNFSQKLFHLNSQHENTNQSINVLNLRHSSAKDSINNLTSQSLSIKKSLDNLKSEYTSVYSNTGNEINFLKSECYRLRESINSLKSEYSSTKESVNSLSLENLKLQKEIKQLKSDFLDKKKQIESLETELQKIVSVAPQIQIILREDARKKILQRKIKHHREKLISSLKKSLKDDIEIKLLPNYQYQISCKKVDEPLSNFRELLSSFENKSVVTDNQSKTILFNPIDKEIDEIMQHANEKYGNKCGINSGEYEENLDDFIKYIHTV